MLFRMIAKAAVSWAQQLLLGCIWQYLHPQLHRINDNHIPHKNLRLSAGNDGFFASPDQDNQRVFGQMQLFYRLSAPFVELGN